MHLGINLGGSYNTSYYVCVFASCNIDDMTISQLLVQALSSANGKNIYGITGDAINYFVQAVEASDQMKWIAMRHEGNAAFAACTEAALNGLGICAGTVGPGALHLMNGLYNAKKDRLPVIAITGQIEREHRGKDYFQESNLERAFDDVCAYQAIIRDPKHAASLILKAIRIAVSERTVTRVELPRDLGDINVEDEWAGVSLFPVSRRLSPHTNVLGLAASLINEAKKITLLAGEGCRYAKDEVLALSAQLKAPIVHTLKASDIFDHSLPQVAGLTGLIGMPSGYRAVKECDLLLMLGTDFPYEDFLPKNVQVVQVDSFHRNLANRLPVQAGIHGDVAITLQVLSPMLTHRDQDEHLSTMTNAFRDWKSDAKEKFSENDDSEPMHPQVIAQVLDEVASEDAIFILETSTAAIWAARHLTFSGNRRVLASFNHGSMSIGLAGAIGAGLGQEGREVWALCGDGGFGMGMQDLITASRYDVPIKVIIFNNGSLQLINLEMEQEGQAPNLEAARLMNPDFAAYAQLCGGNGSVLTKAQDTRKLLSEAKASPVPYVLDAMVSGTEIPMPPHISPKEAIKLTQSKWKAIKKASKGDEAQKDYLLNQMKSMMG